MSEQQNFDWGPLGETWWTENGAACRASVAQIRFTCARHQGSAKSRAAALAGYSGDADGIRSAGVRAASTRAVQDLLALAAAAEAGTTDDPVTIHEAKGKVGKLVRSPDPMIALKASELFVKLEVAERQRRIDEAVETTWEDDVRAILSMTNGLGHCAMCFLGAIELRAPRLDLNGIPLFRELAPEISQKFPELWEKMRVLLDTDCQADLARMAAGAITPIAELVPKMPEAKKLNGGAVEEESGAVA